jgi:hypothetical protein
LFIVLQTEEQKDSCKRIEKAIADYQHASGVLRKMWWA